MKIIFLIIAACILTGCAGNVETGFTPVTTINETTQDFCEDAQETTNAKLFVYLCGAVVNPGVYEIEAGSRIYQAIELGGGLRDDAAASAINLVEVLYDGEQIYVPTAEEVSNGWQPQSMSKLVNINTATKEQLLTLTGIGEAKALAIISYREKNGAFEKPEDIMKVSGIKQSAYDKIKDQITTG